MKGDIQLKNCANIWLYQSWKLWRFERKLWIGEAVSLMQYSFIGKIRFSQNLMLFYLKEELPKINMVYLQEEGAEGVVFLDALTLLDLVDPKKRKKFLYSIDRNAFVGVVLGTGYCETKNW